MERGERKLIRDTHHDRKADFIQGASAWSFATGERSRPDSEYDEPKGTDSQGVGGVRGWRVNIR